MFDEAVIAGSYQTKYQKKSDRPVQWYLTDAITGVLERTGISKQDVDGLAVTSFQLRPDNVSTVAQDLGLEIGWAFQGAYGGASGVISVLEAARAIKDGLAEVVVCAAADAFTVASHMDLVSQFTGSIRDYVSPYGFGGANGLFALVQKRHMFEYGTTLEQLGKIAVTQRKHAILNPNAILRDPLSLDDYLNARLIADPIRLFDCVHPCSGGDAIILTTPERARDLPLQPIRILSGGQRHNYNYRDIIPLTQGWVSFSDRLFTNAAIKPDDIGFVQLYDDYPIMVVIQLEDLGFCEKGKAGEFIESTDLSLTGELPLNTGGGQLSAGQSGAGGGMIGVTEAVIQMQGLAGPRQVKSPEYGLVSGFGMVSYGRGLSCSAMILGI